MLVNAVIGTLIAWVLVRDDFRGKALVNAVIDLPFALPTIVAGLTLLALYGPQSPLGVNVAYTRRRGRWLALLFVTLPFVVRAVQPVLLELDREMEEAAASLGARPVDDLPPDRAARTCSRRSSPGVALAFARAVGEFGSVVLISGNIPFETEVASVYIFSQIESDDVTGAAAVSVVLLVISFAVLLLDRRDSATLGDEARWLAADVLPLRRARLPAARCCSVPLGDRLLPRSSDGLAAGVGRGDDARVPCTPSGSRS